MQPVFNPGSISHGEEAGCLGKTPWPSESSARAGMQFLQGAGTMRTGDGLQPYKCKYCPEWHLGHPVRRA